MDGKVALCWGGQWVYPTMSSHECQDATLLDSVAPVVLERLIEGEKTLRVPEAGQKAVQMAAPDAPGPKSLLPRRRPR